jgi:hypothetical protein
MKHLDTLRIFMSFLGMAIIYAQSNDFANSMQMLQLVNNARIAKNVRPLCISKKLVNAATAHSAYQASINTMTHDGPLSLGDRFVKQGYQPSSVAENVGFTSTPFTQVVFDIWMSSPEHRANILDPNYFHFGAASSVGSNGMYFWTQLFAKPLNPVIEPCDFAAAATAAALTPGQPGFDPNGAWGGSSNYNSYNPRMNPNGNCVAVENGAGGTTLSCRLGARPNPINNNNPPGPVGNYNPMFGAGPDQFGPYNNNRIADPNPAFNPNGPNPAFNQNGPNPYMNNFDQNRNPSTFPSVSGNPSCTVVSTSPSPDGQGSVRVLSCKSTGPINNNNNWNNPGTPFSNPPGVQPVANGGSIIINPEGNFVNPSSEFNQPRYKYNRGSRNPSRYNNYENNPPGFNPSNGNPPGYNPPGFNPSNGNQPGYNPPGQSNSAFSPFWN